MCDDVNGQSVARASKFTSTHQLLSYSLATNVPGAEREYFACRQGDSERAVNDLAENFVNQLLSISEKSFDQLQNEYSDVILALEQAITEENVFNAGKTNRFLMLNF